MLKGKTVVLGVTGSIAAYKIANLASMLSKLHADIHVLMTQNATNFINPITFETLTGNKCLIDTFDRNFQFNVEHVSLAKKADVVLIAPASANVIGKLANGIADDMLTTTVMACKCKKIISPAMNTNMYENSIVQDNIAKLKRFGMQVIEPDVGLLACKDVVNEPFAVINADDYYGKEGLKKVHEYLCNPAKSDKKFNFCMAGFEVGNTLSDNGTVTRGICQVKDGILTKIVETKEIGRGDNCATTPDGNVPLNQPVSMNMWGLTPDIFPELEKRFVTFLGSIEGNEMKAEYLIPTIIGDMVEEGLADVHVLPTSDKWFGVTYKEDKALVVSSFGELVEQGVYKKKLWE
mgnify:CR=1 FL=1